MRIYPVFIPHQGCPFQCVYCNQHAVTTSPASSPDNGPPGSGIREELALRAEQARTSGSPGEIAFYGGTFTSLPRETMVALLEEAALWVRAGIFTGIRFSTRPDAIDVETCRLLKEYPVRTVELGVQSLSDEVLGRSRRGYAGESVERAVALVHRNEWVLGVQMMPGLPGDTKDRFRSSVAGAIDLGPAFVRIYPTIVLHGTVLARWFREGTYRPLSLEQAIDWCVPAYDAFLQAGIPVARMGLHADPELRKPGRILAGPYHPSFGYLVRVHWWRQRIDRYLSSLSGVAGAEQLVLHVPGRSLSEAVGPRRCNIKHWEQVWNLGRLTVSGRSPWPPGRFECTIEKGPLAEPSMVERHTPDP